MPIDERPTVYSTEHGDLRKPASHTRAKQSLPLEQQVAYIHRESKGRGGKTVSIIKNLQLSDDDLKELTRKLKQICGTGGTVKDGNIEIQGDHREKIAASLRSMGIKTKLAGG